MARCRSHDWGDQRGRPPSDCWECQRLTQENKEKKAAAAKAKGLLTRAAGQAIVEQEYSDVVHAVYEEARTARAAVEREFETQIAPYVKEYDAAEAVLKHKLEKATYPFRQDHEQKLIRINAHYDLERGIAEQLKQKRLENLEMRCHQLVGKSYCNKYLDYNGHCPVHGEIGAPGE